MTRIHRLFVLGLAPWLALAAPARDAAACGGTFCDSGPKAMPVDQSGENILFVLDGKFVEAHVQIQYSGDPARFAWIVPMPAVPTVTAGSEQLFTNLLQATVPSYGFTTQRDFCPCTTCGFGGAAASGGATSYFPGGTPISADGGVTVIFQKTVGAFEVTALSGHTSQQVIDWLSTNGYQSAATAPALLDAYVKKGNVFVAVKLTAGKGSNQIHPLVFRYAGTEACIPLQLTAVAAVEDMGVRAFFLGDDRAVSTNYGMVTLNPARIDWLNLGKNYVDAVTRAVDAAPAAGHGFVTEYAGASAVVQTSNLSSPAWDESSLGTVDALGAAAELEKQGLLQCSRPAPSSPGVCNATHPLVFPLLHDFVPPLAGQDDATFYSCVSCVAQATDYPTFDAAAFSNAVRDRIFAPGRHAASLVGRWPHLTRLFTTISPSEMTEDPLFETRPGLPDVALPSIATQRITTTGASGFTLPDGRAVAITNGVWPPFSSLMPWAERVESYPAGGKPLQVLADGKSAVDSELAKWNASQKWPAPPPDCSQPGGGGGASGGFGGTSGGGAFGGGGAGSAPFDGPPLPGSDAGVGGAGGSHQGKAAQAASDTGGGCSVAGVARQGTTRSGLALAAGLLLARAARRRRSRSAS